MCDYYRRKARDTSLEILCRLAIWGAGISLSLGVWYGVISLIRRLF